LTNTHSTDLTILQRMRRRVPRLRFKDPVQRSAHLHLFDDLAWVDERSEAYRAEDAVVRRQVIMELERRVELLGPGRSAPAWSSLIQAAVAAVTIFGTLLLAVFNGWFAGVVTMMDRETGVLRGVTRQQISDTMSAVQTPIVYALGILLFVVAATLVGAAAKDAQRGTSLAWLHVFAEVDRAATATSTSSSTQLSVQAGPSLGRFARTRRRMASADCDQPTEKLR
jgi:hypothetical protein